jgi:tetratricopeptide (TPR) repeat protein
MSLSRTKWVLWSSLLMLPATAMAQQSWGVQQGSKSESRVPEEADLQRSRVVVTNREIERGEPGIELESVEFQDALRTRRQQKTEELIEQLETLIKRPGQSNKRGELQMRLAEMYYERSQDVAFKESEGWQKQVSKWDALPEAERAKTKRPTLRTPQADRHRRTALALYEDLERRSRGGDLGRSQLISRDEVLFYLGTTLVDLGEGQRGLPFLVELQNKFPNSEKAFAARVQLADLLFDRRKYKEATPLYLNIASQASKKSTNEQLLPYALYKLGWCYLNTGEHKKSVLAFKRTAEISKESDKTLSFRRESLNDLTRAFSLAGEYDNGTTYFEELGSEGEPYLEQHLRSVADVAGSRGQNAKALAAYDRLIKNSPDGPAARDDSLARLNIILRMQGEGAWVKALDKHASEYGADSDWMEARSKDERKLYTDELVGLMRREAKNRHAEAQRRDSMPLFRNVRGFYEVYFKHVPKPNPDTAANVHEMRFYQGELLYKLGDFAASAEAYERAGAGKYQAQASYSRILALREGSAKDKSLSGDLVTATEDFMKKNPTDERGGDLLYAAAYESFQGKDKEDAERVLNDIVDRYPDKPVGLKAAERLLFIYEESGDLENAIKGADRLSKNAKLMAAHGKALKPKLDEFKQAASFKQAQGLPEESPSDFKKKSLAYLGLAKGLSPVLKEKALNNARVFAEKSKDKELLSQANAALLREFPKSQYAQGLYFQQGSDFARKGDWRAALASFQQFIATASSAKDAPAKDIEEAKWNRIYIQAHLDDVWEPELRPRADMSPALLTESQAFFSQYPASGSRAQLVQLLAYRKGANARTLADLRAQAPKQADTLDAAAAVIAVRNNDAQASKSLPAKYPPAKVRDAQPVLKRALASVAFDAVDPAYQKYQATKISFAGPAFAKTLQAKLADLEKLEAAYVNVVAYGDGDTALKSLERLSGLYKALGEEILKAPIDDKSELKPYTDPLFVKSTDLLRTCLAKAVEFKISGAGLQSCRQTLKAQDRSLTLLEHETILAPAWVAAQSDKARTPLLERTQIALVAGRMGEALLGITLLQEQIAKSELNEAAKPYVDNMRGLYEWREGLGEAAARSFRLATEATGSEVKGLRMAAFKNLGALYLQVGDYAEAQAAAEEFASSDADAALIAGVSMVAQGKGAAAAKLFSSASGKFKDRRDLLFHLALAQAAGGDAKAAHSSMKRYVELETPSASHPSRALLRTWRPE